MTAGFSHRRSGSAVPLQRGKNPNTGQNHQKRNQGNSPDFTFSCAADALVCPADSGLFVMSGLAV